MHPASDINLKEKVAHVLGFCVKMTREFLRKSCNFSGELGGQ